MNPAGSLCLVLHGHLPFVRHPEQIECLEEDWFFEAVTEVYLPLADLLTRLTAEKVPFKLALGLSPTLVAMFQDPLLCARYDHHLENLIHLSESECRRTQGDSRFSSLSRMYRDRFLWCQTLWRDTFHRDLTAAFRRLQQTGNLELLTTAATHGFLPLMEVIPAAMKAQIAVGIESFQRAFGCTPFGFWLPECGMTPMAADLLAQAGIRYTFVETHGLLHAAGAPPSGVYRPVRTEKGLALFGRDPETANQVWSSVEGYPGDFSCRDFYRDVGFDLEERYLAPFLYHGGIRVATGLKYYRVTGNTSVKEPYDPARAREKVKEQAENFVANRRRQIADLSQTIRDPVVVSMYDAELFGHWWFEGTWWLEEVLRRMAAPDAGPALNTPSQTIRSAEGTLERVGPHLSTWGWKGYNEVWLQGANAWIYRHLHRAAWRMEEIVARNPAASGIVRRAANQALRELLLAQSSDWAFIMGQGTSAQYARERMKRHTARFTKLYEQLQSGAVEEEYVAALEEQDDLFGWLDYSVYTAR